MHRPSFLTIECQDFTKELSLCARSGKNMEKIIKMCLMCLNAEFHSEDVNINLKAQVKLVTFTPSSHSLHCDPSRKMAFLLAKCRNFDEICQSFNNSYYKKKRWIFSEKWSESVEKIILGN